MTDYITITEVKALHYILIEKYGGSHGLRDEGALESALYRPQSGYYKDIIEEAAALWESLSQNHSFIDGNKRIAFAVTDVFLRINGIKIKATSKIILEFITKMYETNTFEYKKLDDWIRKHI